MKVDQAQVIRAEDEAVQRVALGDLRAIHDGLGAALAALTPPPGDPAEAAGWQARAANELARVEHWRDILDDVSRRREMKARCPAFAICVPTLGRVSIFWTQRMMGLACPINSSSTFLAPVRVEVGTARNLCVEAALASKPRPDYLFFVDDDVLLPWDTLQRLVYHDKAIVGGLYHLKQTPSWPLLWRNDRPGYLRAGKDFQMGELVKVDGTGCGCLLVKMEVFEKLERPWFKTGPTMRDGERNHHTEDSYFLKKAAEAGYEVFVDTGIRCGHEDRVTGKVY